MGDTRFWTKKSIGMVLDFKKCPWETVLSSNVRCCSPGKIINHNIRFSPFIIIFTSRLRHGLQEGGMGGGEEEKGWDFLVQIFLDFQKCSVQ